MSAVSYQKSMKNANLFPKLTTSTDPRGFIHDNTISGYQILSAFGVAIDVGYHASKAEGSKIRPFSSLNLISIKPSRPLYIN